ncbi:MAG: TonB-dependent receptor [Acidobacteria bacterium]|uniref:TonB-dependent receptor n=1 Tax=Candidatus Polarisedimenticola svalbardensis TaxID=2886004 RepID=A0A8J7CMA0_9BACT|nr:TonB-dependent receptor [Candidatus Polarisedimenticola svalbardensis]
MKAGRGLLVLFCLWALCLPWTGFTLAQEQEQEQKTKPETEESKQKAEDEKKESEEEKKGPEESGLIEKVKVTATRVETDLMKTPIAISVFDQDTLNREGVQNVRDLAQMVPNMDIATKNGQSTPIISMRGIRSTNETELGDPSVGVHLDGIYSPRMQGALALMFDNERVEILRGPQGTLFGRNSTVGSINIITAKPKLDRFESSINMQYGNYNAQEVQAIVNKPISDTFAVRFAGRFHQRDSYLTGYWDPNQYDQRYIADRVADAEIIALGSFEDCTSPECYTRTQKANWWVDDLGFPIRALVRADDDDFYMNAEEWAYRVSTLWQPKDKDVSWNFSFQHYRSDSAGGVDLVNCEKLRGRPVYELDGENELVLDDGGNPIVIGTNDCSDMFPEDDTYQAAVNVPGRLYLDIMYLRSQFNWDINDTLRFIYSAGFEDQDRESAQDMEQGLNAWDQAMVFLPGTGSQSHMHEFQLQSQGNPNFNWITGVNFFTETTSTIGFFDNAIDEKSYWDQPDRSTTSYAAFAQGTYSYTDKWHMTIGSRFSDETKEDKGGRSLLCNVANGCASDVIDAVQVNQGLVGFDREDLNSLPADYFADPSVYADDDGNPVFFANDNKGSWTHSDWRVGLDYQKSENTLLYSYIATGFKAGGIGDVFEGTVVDGGIDDDGFPYVISAENTILRTSYDPEEVTTLELGFKSTLLDRKLELRGAYFYSDYENMQYAAVGSLASTERWQLLLDLNGDPIDANEDGRPDFAWIPVPLFVAYYTQNVPGAQIQGFEFEYDWRPWTGGRIRGYASWIDTEIAEDWVTKWDYDPISYFGINFDDSVDASNERLEVNLKGNNLAVSPPFKFHMTLDHAFLLKRRKMTIVPWITAHWEDDSYLTIWNVDQHKDDLDFVILDQDIRYTDDKREAWSMLHAGVRMYRGDMTAELYAYNITDEVVQWWGGAAEQVPKGSMSMPVSYGFRVGYKF